MFLPTVRCFFWVSSLWQSFRIVFVLCVSSSDWREDQLHCSPGAHHSRLPCFSPSCFLAVLCGCALCMPQCSVACAHLFMWCSHVLSCVMSKGLNRFLLPSVALPLHSDPCLQRGALGFKFLLALNSVWSDVCEPLGPSTSPLFSYILSKHNDSSEPPSGH